MTDIATLHAVSHRRFLRLSSLFIAAACVFAPSATAAKKTTAKAASKRKVAAGAACTPVGAQSAGLDCVTTPKGPQWQARGSRFNPIHLNDAAEYTAYEGNRYRLKITGLTPLTAADIMPGGTGKYPIPAGMAPFQVGAELTYLGPKDSNDLPASITTLALVNADGRKFDTYAGDDKSGGECQQYGEHEKNGTRSLVAGVPLTSGFCVVLTTASVGPSLLVNLSWLNDPSGIWFKTTP